MNIKSKLTKICVMMATMFSLAALPVATQAIDVTQGACKQNANSAPCKASGDDIASIIGNVINLLLFVAGAIATLVIVIGGIRYITSDGDPAATNKAKNTIIYALVGLVVAIMSYAIVNFVIGRI